MSIFRCPTTSTVQITGRCGIQKDSPWNITVILLSQFFFLFPTNQTGINKKIHGKCLSHIGIYLFKKTADIAIIRMFRICNCFPNNFSLRNKFTISKFVRPVHHLRHMLIRILVNIIECLLNSQFL